MNNIESAKGEIVMYQPDETIRLEVRVENETVWLNRQQIAALFSRDIKTIGKHINNALHEELDGESVGAKFATTAADGKTYQVEYNNLDMIMSVGYRVNLYPNARDFASSSSEHDKIKTPFVADSPIMQVIRQKTLKPLVGSN